MGTRKAKYFEASMPASDAAAPSSQRRWALVGSPVLGAKAVLDAKPAPGTEPAFGAGAALGAKPALGAEPAGKPGASAAAFASAKHQQRSRRKRPRSVSSLATRWYPTSV